MTVFGPDGREWSIVRRSASSGALASLVPGGEWFVEAVSPERTRRWRAASRRAAGSLVTEVALAVRTGAPGPAGELAPDEHLDDGEPTSPGDDERGGPRSVSDVAER